jgi:hypothetical protein
MAKETLRFLTLFDTSAAASLSVLHFFVVTGGVRGVAGLSVKRATQ